MSKVGEQMFCSNMSGTLRQLWNLSDSEENQRWYAFCGTMRSTWRTLSFSEVSVVCIATQYSIVCKCCSNQSLDTIGNWHVPAQCLQVIFEQVMMNRDLYAESNLYRFVQCSSKILQRKLGSICIGSQSNVVCGHQVSLSLLCWLYNQCHVCIGSGFQYT